MRKVGFRGSVPACAWRESVKSNWETNIDTPDRDLNSYLPVIGSHALWSTEAGFVLSCPSGGYGTVLAEPHPPRNLVLAAALIHCPLQNNCMVAPLTTNGSRATLCGIVLVATLSEASELAYQWRDVLSGFPPDLMFSICVVGRTAGRVHCSVYFLKSAAIFPICPNLGFFEEVRWENPLPPSHLLHQTVLPYHLSQLSLVENGSVGSHEEVTAAALLARLGVTLDRQGVLVRLNNKENVMDEPKEEDEKRSVEGFRETKETEGAGEDGKMASSGTQTQQSSAEPPGEREGNLSALYHGTWPVERTLWHSGPSSLGAGSSRSGGQVRWDSPVNNSTTNERSYFCQIATIIECISAMIRATLAGSLRFTTNSTCRNDVSSVMSFTSSMGSASGGVPGEVAARRTYSQQQLGAKVEMVYSLLSMLGTHDKQDMSRTLLAMSSSPDSCLAMRQSGCLPLLVQLLHGTEQDPETRQRAAQSLHNVVHAHPDDKRGRREARVLKLLEQVRDYCDSLREMLAAGEDVPRAVINDDMERHPGPTIAALMKLSFDEEHRHAMCQLGGLHAIAELIQVDHEAHGSSTNDQYCVTLRRYAGMALTNLTFGDGTNKALLCSFREFMKALVAQLVSPSEDLRQVTASVLRNLSWRADGASKQTLREVGAVPALMRAAMEGKKESTLKSILSALWNLSAHCSMNKVDICAVEGALAFLVNMLSYKAPSKTLAIVENAGGILRNISSHVAVREDYRAILRDHNCLQVLLQQLKSPSLTIVSNACGTLWNLSARCAEDQRLLWEMGAINMLRSLVHSKHKMISMGSSAALKNLLSARPASNFPLAECAAKGPGMSPLPSLYVRKQRALEQELDQTLAETCENIEPSTSPSRDDKFVFAATERQLRHRSLYHGQHFQQYLKSLNFDTTQIIVFVIPCTYNQSHRQGIHQALNLERSLLRSLSQQLSSRYVSRSESQDSVTSTMSDSVYERVSRSVSKIYGYGQTSPTVEVHVPTIPPPINPSSLTGSLSDAGHIQGENSASSDRRFLRRYCNSFSEREEGKKSLSLVQSNEDNTLERDKHSLTSSVDSSFQRSRLGQIDEASYSTLGSSERKEMSVNCEEINIDKNVKLEVMSLKPATPPPKNLLYNGTRSFSERSAFSPLAASSPSGNSRLGYTQSIRGAASSSSLSNQRNKFSDYTYDDENNQDQPVDYSLKYVEDDPNALVNQSSEPSKSGETDSVKVEVEESQTLNDSVLYAEEVDESEFDKNGEEEGHEERRFFEGSDPLHEDTLKTYCTEGTPYETPYNFSTATSMSDLRCDSTFPQVEEGKEEEDVHEKKTIVEYHIEKSTEDNTAALRTSDSCEPPPSDDTSNLDKSTEQKEPQIKSLPPAVPHSPTKRLSSGLSSGLMSPEKPVMYCEEGTPGSFSRVSSLSSLNSLPVHHTDTNRGKGAVSVSQEVAQPASEETKEELDGAGSTGETAPTPNEGLKEDSRVADREGKVVTFGGADHYAEETPLMFSRCSSLGSLSSFEQHSIHDDRSSVISDFSRRTSGIVSPSELPDSPTQTVPPSPRHSKPPVEFTSRLPVDTGVVRALPVPAARHPGTSAAPKASVFEDDVTAFKEEDTPVEFSRTTSLSSLTIDDEPKISNDAMHKEVVMKTPPRSHSSLLVRDREREREREEGMEKQDVEKEKRELSECCELAPVSEGEEENDEDMLAACINVGMQNSRQRQGSQLSNRVSPARSMSGIPRYQRPSGIPVKTPISNCAARPSPARNNSSGGKPTGYVESTNGVCEDALQTYYTEGTPANISHAGSNSDLSVLSMDDPKLEEKPTELSDDSSNENILAECIQSGMPKARSHPVRFPLPPTPDTTPKKPPSRRPTTHHLCGLDHSPSQPAVKRLGHAVKLPVAKPPLMPAKNELLTFATEGTPNTLSSRSSLSDLTINSSESEAVSSGLKRPTPSQLVSEGDTPVRFATEDTPLEISHAASLSSLSVGEDELGSCKFGINLTDVCPRETAASSPPTAPRTSDADTGHGTHMLASSDSSWCDHDRSDRHEDSASSSRHYNKTSSVSEDVITVLSRNGSLSSLSVDSFGSTEPTPSEQALLEQCINSGMPKGKSELATGKATRILGVGVKKNICSKNSGSPLTRSGGSDSLDMVIPNMAKLELKPSSKTCYVESYAMGSLRENFTQLSLDDERGYGTDGIPKNGMDPSVAVVTTIMTEVAADVEEDIAEENALQDLSGILKIQEMYRNAGQKKEEKDNTSEESINKTKTNPSDNLPTPDQSEESSNGEKSPLSFGDSPSVDSPILPIDIDLRRDGDAMITSLDRMTEELLQQTHGDKEKNQDANRMKQSLVGSDTWNEVTSPNDISCPSLSISAPLVASFKSDNCENLGGVMPDLVEEDLVSKSSEPQDTPSMTDSHMLEVEAGKLALAVQNEANSFPLFSEEMDSMTSLDLDAIKPPSMMGSLISLTTSLSGQLDNVDNFEGRDRANSSSFPPQQTRNGTNSFRIDCRHTRKKSLPAGMMVRRALGNNLNGSLENLADNASISSSCNSHLDNIKPPSAMEELADLENSMVSVASITSEVADSSSNKEHSNSEQSPASSDAIFELLRPAATIMAEVYASQCMITSVHTNSASDCLDNINPPSAFDDLTDIVAVDLNAEPGTETICSDIEMCTEDPGQTRDMVDTPELPSDTSQKTTPVASPATSAESTPKKFLQKPKQLTPKQKRQLVKERYKTYTITAEEEKKMEIARQRSMESTVEEPYMESEEVETDVNETSCFLLSDQKQDEDAVRKSVTKNPSSSKVTPKQRRQEDRQRFQTRVLDRPTSIEGDQNTLTNNPKNQFVDESCISDIESKDAKTQNVHQTILNSIECPESPIHTCMKTVKQRRAEAKDRFQTRTLSDETGGFKECDSPLAEGRPDVPQTLDLGFQGPFFDINEEIENILEHDANIVISSINEIRHSSESSEIQSDDMMLDCETLSLISIESESDHNLNTHYRSNHARRFISHSVSLDEEMEIEKDESSNVIQGVEQMECESSENEDEDFGANEATFVLPKRPKIIKPDVNIVHPDECVESNETEEEATVQSSSKVVRGRRKPLYSSPAKRVPGSTSGLPKSDKARSSIPVVSVSGKTPSNSGQVRPTRASALRQTGKTSTVSPRSVSRTPPSSENGSPRNTSPKINKTTKVQQRSLKLRSSSASSKPSIPKNNVKPKTNVPHNAVKLNETFTVQGEETDPKFRPPERQGTFTKDEPSTPNAPKVFLPPSSPTKTRIPIPSSAFMPTDKSSDLAKKKTLIAKTASPGTIKPKLRRELSQQTPRVSPQIRLTKTLSQDCSSSKINKSLDRAAIVPGKNTNIQLRVNSFNRRSVCVSEMKTSLSNQSLQSNDGTKDGSKQGLAQQQRSTSNCSLNSVTSGSSVKKSTAKRQVTSKIASLWKRVEDSKTKQRFAIKDSRVWIATENEASTPSETDSLTEISPPKLVRSSTFEGSTMYSANDNTSQTVKCVENSSDCDKTKTVIQMSKAPELSLIRINRNTVDFSSYGVVVEKQVAEILGVVQPMTRMYQETNYENSSPEVVLRRPQSTSLSSEISEVLETEEEKAKRLSRLGSFIRIDPADTANGDGKTVLKTPASAIVQPFNYNPPPRSGPLVGSYIPTHVTSLLKRNIDGILNESQDSSEVSEQDYSTASMKVTTV
uniref:Adenomatous polyposis coli protein n=1 Tax=Timema monikensis TaxID=170555 RepID=A0A7R9E008_9NEOP|nr:unnamed protein product [Timema monikensis]